MLKSRGEVYTKQNIMRSVVRVYNDGESGQQIIFCAVEDIKFGLKGNTLGYKCVQKIRILYHRDAFRQIPRLIGVKPKT